MENCIFSAHCTEDKCDAACPIYAETSYLLERNGISINNPVFHTTPKKIVDTLNTLDTYVGKLRVVVSHNTVSTADLITYCAICKNWRGSQLHCTVYNLKFNRYWKLFTQTWSKSDTDTEELNYMKIWSAGAKVLVISGIDFINFGDYECAELLSIIQSRHDVEYTTILVSPPVSELVGKGVRFEQLKKLFPKSKDDNDGGNKK